MAIIVENACEKCGGPIMQPVTAVLGPDTANKRANKCDACGHTTNPVLSQRFQWSSQLKSVVDSVCTVNEQRHLRRDANEFINGILNAKLKKIGKPQIEIDATTTPITLREKTDNY